MFYLVCTQVQADIAGWRESTWSDFGTPAYSSGRNYRVLHTCNEDEFQAATQVVIEYMLRWNNGTHTQLIDLRDVEW